jgi:DNA-binding beta-propeller fold protein YncE
MPTTTPTFQYSHTIGNAAAGGQVGFRSPVDVALGPAGLLYVLNHSYEFQRDGKWVTRCTIDEDYLGVFGSKGSGDGQFTWPNSVAVDKEGNVYVTDEYLHRVSVFDPDGSFRYKWGTQGSGDGEWDRPAGIAFDGEDNLLVADSLNHRIQRFTKDGRFLGQWGGLGNGEGQLNTPWGIGVDARGDVYVADWRNDRVQKFTSDGMFLLQFGVAGDGDGELSRPSGVAVDRDGCVYVVDWGHDRVQVFDPEGCFVTTLMGDAGLSKWGTERLASNPENMLQKRAQARSLEPEKRFFHPVGIEVDSEDRIIVAECGRHRLQIYRKVSVTIR